MIILIFFCTKRVLRWKMDEHDWAYTRLHERIVTSPPSTCKSLASKAVSNETVCVNEIKISSRITSLNTRAPLEEVVQVTRASFLVIRFPRAAQYVHTAVNWRLWFKRKVNVDCSPIILLMYLASNLDHKLPAVEKFKTCREFTGDGDTSSCVAGQFEWTKLWRLGS